MRIRQVKSLVGGETLVEPVITKEKEILISRWNSVKTGVFGSYFFFGYRYRMY